MSVFDGFCVIDQSEQFVVINKSPGVSFHSESGPGLVEKLKKSLGLNTLFPVHRLDKMTSGLLVFAKTKSAAAELGKAFEQKQVEKFYLAVAKGKPKKKQGCIKGPMVKSRNGSYKLLKPSEEPHQHPAITYFFSYSLGAGTRLYLLKPLTGKTHQLRVMMKSLSVPILGDERYGGGRNDRGYLHAYDLRFTLCGQAYHYQSMDFFTTIYDALETNLRELLTQPSLLPWPNV